MNAKADRWPIRPATVRAVLSGHGLLGLSLGALIYLVCLTGSIAVFAQYLQRWEQPSLPTMSAIAPAALDRAVAQAVRENGSDVAYYISLPGVAERVTTIYAYTPEHERIYAVAADGTTVLREAPWTEFLINLHIALHLPRTWGALLVGLIGVALLSVLISGILAHPRVFRDAFNLRLGGSRRLQEADLHNRIGVWAMPFHVTVALTGAALGLYSLLLATMSMAMFGDQTKAGALFADAPAAAVNAAPAPLPPLAPMLAELQRRTPDATPSRLVVEHPGRADARISIYAKSTRLLTEQDSVVFDNERRVVHEQHRTDQVAGTLLLGGIGQLHFGWFGGLPVRLAYGLLGLGLCVVTSSGITIWLSRRRDKGRAAPLWERVWSAVAWGQPLALATVALAAVALRLGEPSLVWLWLALTVAMIGVAATLRVTPCVHIVRALRMALGAVVIAVALAHVLLLSAHAATIAIDLALLAFGAWLLRGLSRR